MSAVIDLKKHDQVKCHKFNEDRCKMVNELREIFQSLETNGKNQYKKPPPPLITYPDYGVREEYRSPPIRDRVAPWELPRFPSRELIGGVIYKSCRCNRHDGMQDKCMRTWCRGRPACMMRPIPVCPPSGIWKMNMEPSQIEEVMRCHWREATGCYLNGPNAPSETSNYTTMLVKRASTSEEPILITRIPHKHCLTVKCKH